MFPENPKIAVIGLGYVGLPLAAEFGRYFDTIGFDINAKRIQELKQGKDSTRELEQEEFERATRLQFTSDAKEITEADIYIVTVPTPVDEYKKPDLTPLYKASETVGKVLKPGSIVIYESTVYPGATEEDCAPILEKCSGLKYIHSANCQLPTEGFYLGYSPERVNPGDKQHRVSSIVKVTSGSTSGVAEYIDRIYARIITAGTHKASSIRVAEAAKVIENTQRDVNIALINELAILFNRLGIDTQEVLEAAGTKWNFLPFRPGLVGGHCIGVDPYYLTHKAQSVGYHPEMILAGRRLNDSMGAHIVSQLIKAMLKKRIQVEGSRILVLGLAFKENCPDLRNTRVIDIVRELREYNTTVDVHDPWVDADEARHEYALDLITELPSPSMRAGEGAYDAIVIAVAHQKFNNMGSHAIRSLGKVNHVLYDVKYLFPPEESDLRL